MPLAGEIGGEGVTNKEIGASIRAFRIEENMSRSFWADTAGISRHSLERYENGLTIPSILAVVKIADVLGCAIDDLIGRRIP